MDTTILNAFQPRGDANAPTCRRQPSSNPADIYSDATASDTSRLPASFGAREAARSMAPSLAMLKSPLADRGINYAAHSALDFTPDKKWALEYLLEGIGPEIETIVERELQQLWDRRREAFGGWDEFFDDADDATEEERREVSSTHDKSLKTVAAASVNLEMSRVEPARDARADKAEAGGRWQQPSGSRDVKLAKPALCCVAVFALVASVPPIVKGAILAILYTLVRLEWREKSTIDSTRPDTYRIGVDNNNHVLNTTINTPLPSSEEDLLDIDSRCGDGTLDRNEKTHSSDAGEDQTALFEQEMSDFTASHSRGTSLSTAFISSLDGIDMRDTRSPTTDAIIEDCPYPPTEDFNDDPISAETGVCFTASDNTATPESWEHQAADIPSHRKN
ncbi:hypothetical protein B0H67DRAFT_640733 [Lasiosphaeris hirsuta]|uniref:Uncharacterized protein n=1 Tax=Lasiosphaeris hirsuta TaxID=260670 RepID=A0AA40AY79_9PEZI|nr:hypothetical protein B0H67DRAFT_640733 [Lasiosphaeris hirsuta]